MQKNIWITKKGMKTTAVFWNQRDCQCLESILISILADMDCAVSNFKKEKNSPCIDLLDV